LLEKGNVLEEAIRDIRGPGQGMVDVAGVDQLTNEGAFFGGLLDRREKMDKRLAVALSGKLLQRATQRLVADVGRIRE